MRFFTTSFLTSALLLGLLGRSQAQQLARPASEPAAPQCAAAHLRAALAQPVHSPQHRQKMERYDLKYTKLDVQVSNTSLQIGGSVLMRARNVSGQPLDSVAFELYSTYTIDSVVVNGRRSPGWHRSAGDVTARIPQAVAANALFDFRVYYRGAAPSGASAAIGNGYSQGSANGISIVWSLSEPFSAYEWFPCKQVLTDKIDSVEVWATTANTNKVGSNGVLRNTVPLPGNQVRYEWKTRYPIDYYLISVACAPYLDYTTTVTLPGGKQFPFVNYLYDNQALTDWQTLIDETPAMIVNFSNLIVPYPFADEKYGHSMAPIGGGMEHQTMTTQDGFSFTLTAHELFHQWFGDNVTCARWQDIWLNESFATYGEYLTLSALRTPADARSWLNQTHGYALARPNQSVFIPDSDTTDVGRIFNYYTTYAKGGTVIHMLRYLLNDDAKFFQALRTYQNTYAKSTARTANMQAVFEQVAGRSLTGFFQQWIYGQGHPTFNVLWNQVGTNLYLRVNETVSTPAVTPFFETDVDYRVNFSSGQSNIYRLHQGQATETFAVGVPAGQTVTSIVVDPDQWILNGTGTVRPDNTLSAPAAQRLAAVQLYPNPATATVALTNLPATATQATVLDATGRVVRQLALTPGHAAFSVQDLAPGLYHVRIVAPGGAATSVRFVKEL